MNGKLRVMFTIVQTNESKIFCRLALKFVFVVIFFLSKIWINPKKTREEIET